MSNDYNKDEVKKNQKSKKLKIFKNLKGGNAGCTVIINDVDKSINEDDIHIKLSDYGVIKRVVVFPEWKCGLVEFDHFEAAAKLMNISSKLEIRNHTMMISYSQMSIDEIKNLTCLNSKRCASKVLHLYISKASYIITVDVLKKICSPHGKVVKIVVGAKNVNDNSVEALVEFESVENAVCAKDNLDGNDIYSSCCNLKVTFSCLHNLQIDKNDTESFDYTVKAPLLDSNALSVDKKSPLNYLQTPYSSYHSVFPQPIYYSYGVMQPLPPYYFHNKKGKQKQPFLIYQTDPTIQENVEGVVLYCKNFDYKLKMENIFNLFCIYGNVIRIHKDKESSAFIQMGNREGANFARAMLHGITAFNKTMEVKITKLTDIFDKEPFLDYTSHSHNRFRSKLQNGKPFRVYAPSQTLHFFNVPESYKANHIARLLTKLNAPEPEKVVVFPKKQPNVSVTNSLNNGNSNTNNNNGTASDNFKSSSNDIMSGLIEYDTMHEALEAVAMANHTGLERYHFSIGTNNSLTSGGKSGNNNNQLCHMRLVFSPVRISEEQAQKVCAQATLSDEVEFDSSTSSNAIRHSHKMHWDHKKLSMKRYNYNRNDNDSRTISTNKFSKRN